MPAACTVGSLKERLEISERHEGVGDRRCRGDRALAVGGLANDEVRREGVRELMM